MPHFDDARYAALQRNCDAFGSLHRSEGFDLNIAECMRLAKPVIATGYAGNEDYLSEDTGFPIRYELRPVQPGQYPEGDGQVWAEADLDHAAEAMVAIVEDRQMAEQRVERAREYIRAELSSDRLADMISGHLERISVERFQKAEN